MCTSPIHLQEGSAQVDGASSKASQAMASNDATNSTNPSNGEKPRSDAVPFPLWLLRAIIPLPIAQRPLPATKPPRFSVFRLMNHNGVNPANARLFCLLPRKIAPEHFPLSGTQREEKLVLKEPSARKIPPHSVRTRKLESESTVRCGGKAAHPRQPCPTGVRISVWIMRLECHAYEIR